MHGINDQRSMYMLVVLITLFNIIIYKYLVKAGYT